MVSVRSLLKSFLPSTSLNSARLLRGCSSVFAGHLLTSALHVVVHLRVPLSAAIGMMANAAHA